MASNALVPRDVPGSAQNTRQRSPDDIYQELLQENTTHFSPEELQRLLLAFKRVTTDRLQGTQFYQIVEQELGWTNLLLRKQLFRAFDIDNQGDVDFREFAEAYAIMLRGTVPELLDFAWRVYHVQGPPDQLSLTDIYTVLRLALSGLEEVRRKQGKAAGGAAEESRFPERAAKALMDQVFPVGRPAVSRREFSLAVLRHRKLVDCLVPGFELIPQDALHRAAEAGELEEVQHLMNVDKLDVDGEDGLQYPTTPLHLASRYGHALVVRELLEEGANPRIRSREGATALDLAVEHNKHPALEAMLEAGADVLVKNARGATAVHTAARCGNITALKSLMSKVPDKVVALKDANGDTPLHAAAAGDHHIALVVFLDSGALDASLGQDCELDVRNAAGQTPLHVAAVHRSYRVARRLIELGADAGAVDFSGRTVLHAAASVPGNEAVLDIILAARPADVAVRDNEGAAALNLAARGRDVRMLKALAHAGSDPNTREISTGYTPLHRAVLLSWFEGVDVLLSMPNALLLRDAAGCTPLDYARTPDVLELLRDYVDAQYPEAADDHPVVFDFGMVFHDGTWQQMVTGPDAGNMVLTRPKVSPAVRQQRIQAALIDKDSVVRRMRRAGLVVHKEKVHMKGNGLSGRVQQYELVRIGVPLYRLQLEAARMRQRQMRVESGAEEDFFIDHATYPETGFAPFTRGQRQRIILNMIEATPAESPVTSLTLGADDKAARGVGGVSASALARDERAAAAEMELAEYRPAGIKLSLYMRLKVVDDFFVLHHEQSKEEVLAAWRIGQQGWFAHLAASFREFFSSARRRASLPLLAILRYFGTKFAFYAAFVGMLGHWMIAPAVTGLVSFGVIWIPVRKSVAVNDPSDTTLKDTYDHPIIFGYGIFLAIWASLLVRYWVVKQKELAFRWGCHALTEYPRTANPYSSATVKRMFVNGTWQYRPATTPAQFKTRLTRITFVSTFAFLLFVAATVANSWGWLYIIDVVIDDRESLHSTFRPFLDDDGNTAIEKDRNLKGTLALYAATGGSALCIYVLNALWEKVAVWLTKMEDYATLRESDISLAVKVVLYQSINTYLSLLYFAYWDQDIDKTAAQLAGIIIVGSLVALVLEYLVPYLRNKTTGISQRRADELADDDDASTYDSRTESAGSGSGSRAGAGGRLKTMLVTKPNKRKVAPNDTIDDGLAQRAASGKGVELAAPGQAGKAEAVVVDREHRFEGASEATRAQILSDSAESSTEFATVLVHFGLIVGFGAVFPLASVMSFILLLVVYRADVWKFCRLVRRPISETTPDIGIFQIIFEMYVVAGIINHCFMLCVASDALQEFIIGRENLQLDIWKRLFIAFCAEQVLVLIFFLFRTVGVSRDPAALVESRSEPLRSVREAYQLGTILREKRYAMMVANEVPLTGDEAVRGAAEALEVETEAAIKYLQVVRYLDSLPGAERRRILVDNDAGIQALNARIALAKRTGAWEDRNEAPTLPGLLQQLVPVVDLERCYVLGKQFREAVWRVWRANSVRLLSDEEGVDPDSPPVVAAIRQLAAADVGITLGQADRYTRLCRYVDAAAAVQGTTCYVILGRLARKMPTGLLGFLETVARKQLNDPGDPRPSSISVVVEPTRLASVAVAKAAVVRRAMYEAWLIDHHLSHDEILDIVARQKGVMRESLERYLLVKRYVDSLDETRRRSLLEVVKATTLALVVEVGHLVREGAWMDGGEPDFRRPENQPATVPDAFAETTATETMHISRALGNALDDVV
ncbi:unnamed protein product [Pedinophyceae sp. YPF-701]|nr:unnamed protein product [Pedinophyceae sp. YPF-701]